MADNTMDHPTLQVEAPVQPLSGHIALAHGTKLAKQRNATIFLWSYKKLIGCFNHETLGPITVDTLLSFIKQCTLPVLPDGYHGYQLAMAGPVELKPYNVSGRNSEVIRCRPVVPTCDSSQTASELRGTKLLGHGIKSGHKENYILFFKDPSGLKNIYEPCMEETSEPDYLPLFLPFESLKQVPSFFKMAKDKQEHEISDELKAACTLSHNGCFERCVVTGQQSTGGPEDPGSIDARWVYPPSVLGWHIGPKNVSKELSWEDWELESDTFNGPSNLIAMRKDVYDLFQKNAFGIDIDALPQAKIYIFDPSQMAEMQAISLPQHPVIEVNDPMARAFLREHFQRCILTGVIGGDVSDDSECSENRIQLMLQALRKSPNPKLPDETLDKRWGTVMGGALKEWVKLMDKDDD